MGRDVATPVEGEIPPDLVRSILAGDCVAFVGAGFSAATMLPDWKDLLLDLLEAEKRSILPMYRRYIRQRIGRGGSQAFDEAAQILEDLVGRDRLLELLTERLAPRRALSPRMERRLRMLQGIPFRAVLTTNYDTTLDGPVPNPDAYRAYLRTDAQSWWHDRFWGRNPSLSALKLHGDVRVPQSVVLSRRDYRRKLHLDPGYQTFLRALFAQRTIFFLGFSFTDAYLNELRSEALALIGYDPPAGPIAYALVNDAPEPMRRHYLQHEGIHLISFSTGGGTDFSGFDVILERLHAQTNPVSRFAEALRGKRILWIDDRPEDNRFERRFMEGSPFPASTSPGEHLGPHFEEVTSLAEARRRLATCPFDLVITHWGEGAPGGPVAVQVLRTLRGFPDGCSPAIVFDDERDVEARRSTALRLGAQDYVFESSALLRSIDRVLGGRMLEQDRWAPPGVSDPP